MKAAVRLLYPAMAEKRVLGVTGDFLQLLGLEVQTERDLDVPVLMKNLARMSQ